MSKLFDQWTVQSGATTDLVQTNGTLTISQASSSAPIVFAAASMGKSNGGTKNNNTLWDNVTNAKLVTQNGADLIQGTIQGRNGYNPFTMGRDAQGNLDCKITMSQTASTAGVGDGDDDDGDWNGVPT